MLGWGGYLLPFVEQDALWKLTVDAFGRDRLFVHNPPHIGLSTVVEVYCCPGDGRVLSAQPTRFGYDVALGSYLGVSGTDHTKKDGILYTDSTIRFTDVTDGTSSTLLVGERPPSPDFVYGWWYGGVGIEAAGSVDVFLGISEIISLYLPDSRCPSGPYHFAQGNVHEQCDMFHFWSLHTGGANFLFCDGSVHFIPYAAKDIMPALATRAGGEAVQFPY
jgi:prepilin-type processing-associated H-X9-DG protein